MFFHVLAMAQINCFVSRIKYLQTHLTEMLPGLKKFETLEPYFEISADETLAVGCQ